MQKVNFNIEDDNFRKIMKEKLEGYSLPVSDDVWNKIEKSLIKKPRKTILWPLISGTAAAAAVALFMILFYPLTNKYKQTDNYETTSSLSGDEKKINENIPVETIQQLVSTTHLKSEKVFITRKTKGEFAEVGFRPNVDVVKEDIVSDEEQEYSSPISESQVKSMRTEKSAQQKIAIYSNTDPFGDDIPQIRQPKRRKSLGLSLGSGGNTAAENATSNNNFRSDAILGQFLSNVYAAEPESKTKELLLKEEFPEVAHRVPLALGMTVKKELNRTFSLETGLVYTYLDSRFENRPVEKRALLQLHYLGIPLNIHTKIIGDKRSNWEVYLSAGGMIEKGFYSHYKQTNYANVDAILEIISNEKIAGLQYSLSLSPGIDYKIYRNYSVYLEPKISYYFDNEQPFSTRTEHPLVIGINAGLRLNW